MFLHVVTRAARLDFNDTYVNETVFNKYCIVIEIAMWYSSMYAALSFWLVWSVSSDGNKNMSMWSEGKESSVSSGIHV